MIYKNAEGQRAIVPFHATKVLHPKVLKSIMRDASVNAEDLQKLLQRVVKRRRVGREAQGGNGLGGLGFIPPLCTLRLCVSLSSLSP